MSVVYSDAALSVVVHYDFHYYCCDNRQYRKYSVINQIKEESVGIKNVSFHVVSTTDFQQFGNKAKCSWNCQKKTVL